MNVTNREIIAKPTNMNNMADKILSFFLLIIVIINNGHVAFNSVNAVFISIIKMAAGDCR